MAPRDLLRRLREVGGGFRFTCPFQLDRRLLGSRFDLLQEVHHQLVKALLPLAEVMRRVARPAGERGLSRAVP